MKKRRKRNENFPLHTNLERGKNHRKEVLILRSELMERYPLVDEFAVIDSGSQDKTLEVAGNYGADVYLASDILPEVGDKRGKGENLWKAIHQLKGDVICYVDADISNIHPRFVYGLVAPLIRRDEVQYVKAFYDRPLNYSSGLRASGGGRVTEILIRPLFSLFYPELTNVIQPLSGEYAARREVLEAIPFPIGYGVETSHLLDLYEKFGLDAFAQTDLDRRVHRNQTTNALGKKSFAFFKLFSTDSIPKAKSTRCLTWKHSTVDSKSKTEATANSCKKSWKKKGLR